MFGRVTKRKRVVYQIIATLLMIPFVLPLIAIVGTSFAGEGFVENYGTVLTQTPFLRSTLNSAIIAVCTIALVYLVTMVAGYAFAKLKFAGKNLLYSAILVGLSLPAIALTVPLFVVVQRLGLTNNYLAVILPLAATTIPFTLLLVRNYLAGLPDEFLEAAKLDGCTSFSALFRIVFPLSRPITAVVIVWTFLQSWNEFFLALLFLQRGDLQTLTQIPAYFVTAYGTDTPKIFAALVLISLPVASAYLLFQKFFERGLSAGALK